MGAFQSKRSFLVSSAEADASADGVVDKGIKSIPTEAGDDAVVVKVENGSAINKVDGESVDPPSEIAEVSKVVEAVVGEVASTNGLADDSIVKDDPEGDVSVTDKSTVEEDGSSEKKDKKKKKIRKKLSLRLLSFSRKKRSASSGTDNESEKVSSDTEANAVIEGAVEKDTVTELPVVAEAIVEKKDEEVEAAKEDEEKPEAAADESIVTESSPEKDVAEITNEIVDSVVCGAKFKENVVVEDEDLHNGVEENGLADSLEKKVVIQDD